MLWLVLSVVLLSSGCFAQSDDEEAAQIWVDQYNQDVQGVYFDYVSADWTYNTNITDHNSQLANEKAAESAAFDNQKAIEANNWDWPNFQNESLKREFSKIADMGYAALSDEDFNNMTKLNSNMTTIYSTATVCNKPGDTNGTCYPLDPDLEEVMSSSRDWDELVWAWEGWRNESGRKMPDTYEQFAELLNKAAVINGYADNGEYWRSWYESADFRQICENLWLELKPLYQQLHAYVRSKLRDIYSGHTFPGTGHIPAHILGNMWAQSWLALEQEMRPYPNKTGLDVTDELIKQGYNNTGLFLLAEDFFVSLGMDPMVDNFWENSMIEKPTDGREVVCHASAWDFYNGIDFRIKQCTRVNTEWLITTHHEMGHIEYFMEYKHQPVQFRDGANPGFHEAIGDVIALSVSTPNHMESIGLLPEGADDPEVDMNFLMSEALKKIAFIPFGYLIDQWRWDLFGEEFDRNNYNGAWWDVRCRYQGISPPVTRSASGDFDAGAKYHVPANTPYIRYFVSYVLQYQFHKAMCDAANYVGPYHRCDVYKSNEAGDLLRAMMETGASRPWPEILEQMTGSRNMTAQPLIDYFQPLMDWLIEENADETLGWDETGCPVGSIVP
ncbi:hypothetical protein LSH36_845g01017 [Paralvinella palmiformis]|uniref:Angiotensin-converting enzyme n=1 Tax=Paralvinella palmiformis TaxID=53620 RepID=A0AAD9IZQ2_9ANNE|nr:hypothetical protein LSH36_845g01017 [Paralvinella palmiformis]